MQENELKNTGTAAEEVIPQPYVMQGGKKLAAGYRPDSVRRVVPEKVPV